MDFVNKYWQDKQAYDASHQPVYVNYDPMHSPVFNNSILFKTIDDIDSMSDQELRDFIGNNFMNIISNVFDPSIKKKYAKAYTNIRFLKAFTDILITIPYLDQNQIAKINYILYSYISLQDDNRDPVIENQMFIIGSIINSRKLVQIRQYHLSDFIENMLCIALNSGFDLAIIVKRIDLIIVTSDNIKSTLVGNDIDFDETVYKEEKLARLLVDLYGLENIPYVFPYFMVDITLSGLATDEWITEGLEEMDSLLDLAFLYILEFIIPNPQIVKAMLLNYAEGYRMRNNPPAVRFSFNRLSNEYIRISTAVNELRDENIIVP